METTCDAIITGDRITWIGNRPDAARPIRGRVHVEEVLDPSTPDPKVGESDPITSIEGQIKLDHGQRIDEGAGIDGRELAALCEEIAQRSGGIRSIPDPVAWQREQRAERPMPGREP